ncbi:unnamed protein product [Knipowitschia caucasica]
MAPPMLTAKAAVAPYPRENPHSTSGDMECPICYQDYNLHNKCPRMLECLHVFCTDCLHRIQLCPMVPGDPLSPDAIPCPLCRHLTPLERGDAQSLPCNSHILARLNPMPFPLPITLAQRVVLSLEGEQPDARYIILPTLSLRVQQRHPDRPHGTAPGLMGEEEVIQQSRRTLFWVKLLAGVFWVVFVVICVIGVVFGPHFFNRKC